MELQRWGQIFKPHNNLWRAGLPALGREAALDADATFCLKERGVFYWGCCAAQRGQARSPQGRCHTLSLRIHSRELNGTKLQRRGQIFKPRNNLWRAGLPALGREAAPPQLSPPLR